MVGRRPGRPPKKSPESSDSLRPGRPPKKSPENSDSLVPGRPPKKPVASDSLVCIHCHIRVGFSGSLPATEYERHLSKYRVLYFKSVGLFKLKYTYCHDIFIYLHPILHHKVSCFAVVHAGMTGNLLRECHFLILWHVHTY